MRFHGETMYHKARPDTKPGRRIEDPQTIQSFRQLGQRCLYCAQPRAVDAHHVLPRGRGGDDLMANLVPLCRRCHGAVHGLPYLVELEPGKNLRVEAGHVRRVIGRWLNSDDGQEARGYLAGKLGAGAAKAFMAREYGVRG